MIAGCERAKQPVQPTDEITEVAIQLNWFPEVEHGGVYQALAETDYTRAGLKVDVRPGGRATPIAPELSMGRCQFAILNADDVVLYRAAGVPVVALLAAAQQHPRCILIRADAGVANFEDLAGRTLQCQAGRAYLKFLQARGVLDDVRLVPYSGSISAMLTDPTIAVQGYVNAEPLLAQQQGVDVTTLLVRELGWNPYSSVLVTTESMIADRPEVVRRFVAATAAGWTNYLKNPTLGNAAILRANPTGMTEEAVRYGAEVFNSLAKTEDDSPLGSMTRQRWQTLIEQLESLKLIDPGQVDAEDCYDGRYLEMELTTKHTNDTK